MNSIKIKEHIYEQSQFGENWFSYPILYSGIVKKFPSGSRFVEVGSWKGKSSAYMAVEIANSNKDIEFYCIDTWEGSVEHEGMKELPQLYNIFLDNMKSVEEYYFPLKIYSLDACKKFKDNSLDFVFLDASHEYEDIKKDIKAWLPKIKSGGILAGHDYYNEGTDWFPGVKQAVNEMLDEFDCSEDCWIYYKEETNK
jgi:predicted O-methyltransferase YrrM